MKSSSLPDTSDSTSLTLGLLSNKQKKLSCLPKTSLVSQAIWNITLVSAESAYSIATYVTDLFKLDPYAYGMSAAGMGIGAVGGLMLGGSETYSHWAQGSHFAHGDSHGHSHGPHAPPEEETKQELPASAKLTWTQSLSSGLHYLSDSISGTAFPLMAYKTLCSLGEKEEKEEPSPFAYAAIAGLSLFCNMQTLLNTRSAFRRENERQSEESRRGQDMA